MRLLHVMVAGLTFVLPAVAPAQAVKREDLIGTWVAKKVTYTGQERRQLSATYGILMEVPVRATLYADGMLRFRDADPPGYKPKMMGLTAGTHGSGRWRLSGDTLWWGTDARYGDGMLYCRGELPEGPVIDTATWKGFPANDSLFWTATQKERGGGYWHLTAYKVSLKGNQLTLTRIADRSNNEWDPPGGTFEKKTKPAQGINTADPICEGSRTGG